MQNFEEMYEVLSSEVAAAFINYCEVFIFFHIETTT